MKNLCLNMIVKNESHIIEKTLHNLIEKIPQIDYYVISDTGSTDETIDRIKQFFMEHQISGEIYKDEWKDFSYNRNKALQYALGKSHYLFIFDADDEIVGNFALPDIQLIYQNLPFDGIKFTFKSGNISYGRLLLIKNCDIWEWKGVLHEYLHCKSKNPKLIACDGDYHIVSGREGSRNKDPLKYKKDAILLEDAYEKAKREGDDIYHR